MDCSCEDHIAEPNPGGGPMILRLCSCLKGAKFIFDLINDLLRESEEVVYKQEDMLKTYQSRIERYRQKETDLNQELEAMRAALRQHEQRSDILHKYNIHITTEVYRVLGLHNVLVTEYNAMSKRFEAAENLAFKASRKELKMKQYLNQAYLRIKQLSAEQATAAIEPATTGHVSERSQEIDLSSNAVKKVISAADCKQATASSLGTGSSSIPRKRNHSPSPRRIKESPSMLEFHQHLKGLLGKRGDQEYYQNTQHHETTVTSKTCHLQDEELRKPGDIELLIHVCMVIVGMGILILL